MRASSVPSLKLRGCRLAVALFIGLLPAAPALAAFTIDFEAPKTGSMITTQYLASHGVTFSADNYRDDPNNPGPNAAILFHSSRDNTPDDDLEWDGNWAGGNMNSVECRKILIVAESIRDVAPADGYVDQPDDEAVGGTLFMKFTTPQTSIGFDLIDIELNPGLDVIEFRRNGLFQASVSLDKFTNPASIWYDPTVLWVDRSADRIQPMTIQKLGIQPFDEVRLYMPECGALDNIVFDNTIIPEPAAGTLLLLPVLVKCARRRRRG